MIQQSKIEPSIQNALLNADLHTMEMKRRASVTSFTSNFSTAANRKKSSAEATGAGSPATSNYRSSLINAAVAAVSGSSNAPNSAVDSGSSAPASPTAFGKHAQAGSTNLNEVKISPSGEKREEARRASVKLQHQQMQQLQSLLEAGQQQLENVTISSESSTVKNVIPDFADNDDDDDFGEEDEDDDDGNTNNRDYEEKSGVPPLPLPLSTPSSENIQMLSSNNRNHQDIDNIRIIDETSGDNDETGSSSSVSLRERL
jgi:hypothetical protein